MTNAKKSQNVVVVTGDVTMDWNLARTRRWESGGAVWNADDCTRAYWQRGGAALLADLIEAVAAQLRESKQGDHSGSRTANYEVRQMAAPKEPVRAGDERYHHSYAMWSLFNYSVKSSHNAEKLAWRVEEFLGLDRSTTDGPSRAADWKRVVDDTADASLVILDDADLGFRDHQDLWPKALTTEGNRPWILLKMARPVAQGDLWVRLHKHCTDRLIVVMTVNDLRLTEVQISRELSWERTAQDLAWELVHNPRVNALSHCAHVVVSFDTAGAFLLSQLQAQGKAAGDRVAPKCRLFFDPNVIEGMWGQGHPGGMIGYTSCLAAGIARQLMLAPEEPNIMRGIQSGLAVMRKLHLEGYGERGTAAPQARLAFPNGLIAAELAKDCTLFAEAEVQDPLRFLTRPTTVTANAPEAGFWTILEDRYTETLGQAARRIVLEGAKGVLQGVPLGQFGDLLTVDRREIESFRSIRALVGEYVRTGGDKPPLSVAVFGAPGSGKSFGITQVAKSLLPDQIKKLEFNLSQFGGQEALRDALHQVRDVGLSGLIPVVFWDEFDTALAGKDLGWLRYFLAPMQDGSFQEGQITHPIGRSIFVFAGGISTSMEMFDKGPDDEKFRVAKGPDFVSRLKGYVNILGPNPQKATSDEQTAADPYYIIRRAILLRSILQGNKPELFEERDGKQMLDIDEGVLRAFLETRKYKHGARSMESLIAMSLLTCKRRFERSSLPAGVQLDLHVDARDFLALVHRIELTGELLEGLAEATHEGYCEWFEISTSEKPYANLPEDEKEQNRGFARDIPNKLARLDYVMVPARGIELGFEFSGDEIEQLAEMEHDRWMKAKTEAGWRWAPKTDKGKKLHEDLLPWRDLSDEEKVSRYSQSGAAAMGKGELPKERKKIDLHMVQRIPKMLTGVGYTIAKAHKDTAKELSKVAERGKG